MAGYDHRGCVSLGSLPFRQLAEFIAATVEGRSDPLHVHFTRILDKPFWLKLKKHTFAFEFSVTCIKPKRGKGKGQSLCQKVPNSISRQATPPSRLMFVTPCGLVANCYRIYREPRSVTA